MGYINPLFKLPAGRSLLALPPEQRAPIESLMRQLRDQANKEAENSWRRRKGPMAAYWRAVSTYARHIAHAMQVPSTKEKAEREAAAAGYVLCTWTKDHEDACHYCSGELCSKCGAGHGGPAQKPCEHDSLERHELPEDEFEWKERGIHAEMAQEEQQK